MPANWHLIGVANDRMLCRNFIFNNFERYDINNSYTVRHKNTPKFIDRNLKTDCQNLTIFVTNISNTSSGQMTAYVPASPNFCFCTTWGKQNNKNITFLFNASSLFVSPNTHLVHFDQISSTLADSLSNCLVVRATADSKYSECRPFV